MKTYNYCESRISSNNRHKTRKTSLLLGHCLIIERPCSVEFSLFLVELNLSAVQVFHRRLILRFLHRQVRLQWVVCTHSELIRLPIKWWLVLCNCIIIVIVSVIVISYHYLVLLNNNQNSIYICLLMQIYTAVKVQHYRWGNATFRFGPLTMVVCLFLAL